MSNQEITLWLNVAQICIVVVGGICIYRKIIGKTCNPVKAIREIIDNIRHALNDPESKVNNCTEWERELNAMMREQQKDKSDRQQPNKDSSGDGG